jgi:hypothetical protein
MLCREIGCWCVPSFMSSAQGDDYGDDNDDGVLQQRKSQGRGMSACVIIFSGCIYTELIVKFLGDKAGIVIAQEAGGFATGSKDTPHDGVVTESILTGRRYLIIRGVAGTSVRRVPSKYSTLNSFPICPFTQEESSLDAQKRIAREFYDTVEDIPLDE